MNTTDIECFIAAASTLSFTKTAEQLFLTRQAVSRKIQTLEEALETKLFDRGVALQLTPSGKAYYQFFSETKIKWDLLQDRLKSAAITSELLVSCLDGLNIPAEIHKVLLTLCERYGVGLKLSTYDMHDLTRLVQTGEQDLILTYNGPRLESYRTYHHETIMEIPMVLVAENSICPNASTASEFEEVPLCTWLRRGQTIEEAVEKCAECCADFGFFPSQIRALSTRDTCRAEISLGRGVGMCTSIDRIAHMDGVRTFPLAGSSTLSLMWKLSKEGNPLVRDIIEALNQLKKES